MKYSNKKNLLLSILCLIISCHSNSGSLINDQNDNSTQLIEIRVTTDEMKDSSINLSSIVKNVEIIPLEYNGQKSILSNVSKMVEFENKIYVFDKTFGKLCCFDKSGKFKFSLGKRGNKNDQFDKLSDWVLDEDHKRLYLLDSRKSTLKIFNLDGNFIKEIKLNFFTSRISLIKNYIVFYNNYVKDNIDFPFGVLYYDLHKNKIQKFAFPIEANDGVTYTSQDFPFFKNHSSLYFIPAVSYFIFKMNEKSIIPKFKIIFDDSLTVPSEIMKNQYKKYRRELRKTRNSNKILGVFNVSINNNHLLCNFLYRNRLYFLCHETKKNKTYIFTSINNDMGIQSIYGFPQINNIGSLYCSIDHENLNGLVKYLKREGSDLKQIDTILLSIKKFKENINPILMVSEMK